jgi:hypothetical protein
MGGRSNTWQPPVAPPQAWRDSDELVYRVGAPLPPICVFCGARAVDAIRGAIETRGHPFGSLQVLSTRLPVCDYDRRRHRRAVTLAYVKIAVLFVGLLLIAMIPGAAELVGNALLPFVGSFDGTRPAVRAVVLALVVFVVTRFVRLLPWVRGVRPRPVMLRYDRSRNGFVWLHDADPRCLSQLPSVTRPGTAIRRGRSDRGS